MTADDTAALLLEDLTLLRAADQLGGLMVDDARSVVGALRSFHEHWRPIVARPDNPTENLGVRRSMVAAFSPTTLERGLEALHRRWAAVDRDLIGQFEGLVANGARLIEAFTVAAGDDSTDTGATLCHGDPRADNLCFEPDGTVVLYDWQQLAVQFAEADLAWLLATSLTPDIRRANESALIGHYGADPERYRLGLVLPGMAALLLAQRQADREQTRRFITASLIRIGTALADHGVPSTAS